MAILNDVDPDNPQPPRTSDRSTSRPVPLHGDPPDCSASHQSAHLSSQCDTTGNDEMITYSYSNVRSRAAGQRKSDVKITPKTGKVSRAKKGNRVHTCEQCQPSKTFTRAEHLRRHELIHRPPALVCDAPDCGKAYHRKDLLKRHRQQHEKPIALSPPGENTASALGARRTAHGARQRGEAGTEVVSLQ
ncbi:hypothetical protein G3M48_004647 [Beauveria asiatica]|uniref:C2H2-type domain-containing protein n=1 Tax=Beauveria asiatica TaxID=1069075 RepID=A0AAW0RST6_9HYPO